jgi:four helix bundle protein
MKAMLDHQRLDVYKAAIDFVTIADTVAADFPRGRGYLADQLRRAATSIALNIAEGAGEFSQQDKSRFYRMARRSATECAAVLDVCRCLKLLTHDDVENGYTLLQRIISMLTKLARVTSGTGTGTGTNCPATPSATTSSRRHRHVQNI